MQGEVDLFSADADGVPTDGVRGGFEEDFLKRMEFSFPGGNRCRAEVLGDQDRHGTPLGQTFGDKGKTNFSIILVMLNEINSLIGRKIIGV